MGYCVKGCTLNKKLRFLRRFCKDGVRECWLYLSSLLFHKFLLTHSKSLKSLILRGSHKLVLFYWCWCNGDWQSGLQSSPKKIKYAIILAPLLFWCILILHTSFFFCFCYAFNFYTEEFVFYRMSLWLGGTSPREAERFQPKLNWSGNMKIGKS